MFFVAVEMRDNPSLKDKPCAVGGMSMISTANYIARKYGVRSAMPGFIAMKLCPDLILLNHSSEKYREASKEFKTILAEYDPEYERERIRILIIIKHSIIIGIFYNIIDLLNNIYFS